MIIIALATVYIIGTIITRVWGITIEVGAVSSVLVIVILVPTLVLCSVATMLITRATIVMLSSGVKSISRVILVVIVLLSSGVESISRIILVVWDLCRIVVETLIA